MHKNKIKIIFFTFALAQLLMAHIALAQTSQTITDQYSGPEATIRQYLCTPSPNSGGTTVVSTNPNPNQPWTSASVGGQNNPNAGDLYNCINRVYRFAIVFAAIAAVLYIVIAGYLYMSAEGNGETVEKAKSLVTSSITALVILFAGYILLKALNPDLISFKNIQPPSVTPATTTAPILGVGTGGTPVTGNSQNYNLAGYNIGPYATDPNHEQVVTQVYNALQNVNFSSAASIDQYLKSKAATTPITGQMVLSSAQSYNVDPKLIVALMQVDSSLGTQGVGARTHNPGNVGNNDTGATKDWGTWQQGVDAVASWLNNHRAS
jgi:hypothetical protein